jgi:hypothetical protein
MEEMHVLLWGNFGIYSSQLKKMILGFQKHFCSKRKTKLKNDWRSKKNFKHLSQRKIRRKRRTRITMTPTVK